MPAWLEDDVPVFCSICLHFTGSNQKKIGWMRKCCKPPIWNIEMKFRPFLNTSNKEKTCIPDTQSYLMAHEGIFMVNNCLWEFIYILWKIHLIDTFLSHILPLMWVLAFSVSKCMDVFLCPIYPILFISTMLIWL